MSFHDDDDVVGTYADAEECEVMLGVACGDDDDNDEADDGDDGDDDMMMVMLVGVYAEECEAMLEATCGGILVALCRATLYCVNDDDEDVILRMDMVMMNNTQCVFCSPIYENRMSTQQNIH